MRTLLTAAALAAFFLTPAAAQQANAVHPRVVAEAIAQQIEQNYFDSARAQTIAAGLRASAAHGDFDRDTNPLDLATALTTYLHPNDGHLTVRYDSHAGPPAGAGPQSMAVDPSVAMENYGFRHTDILAGGVGVIAMNQFADFDPDAAANTQPARQAADAAIQAVSSARAIIIDLRGSRGGSPTMVGYMGGYFTPAGANIFNTFHSRRGDMSEAPTGNPTNTRLLNTPLYILVDGGTGSASESLPYTLQAAHRATIIGERTDGRANPGGPVPAAEGFSVFISFAAPINPNTHTNWEGAGVQPDVVTSSADALTRAHQLALERLGRAQDDSGLESRWTLQGLRAQQTVMTSAQLAPYLGDYGETHIASADGHLTLSTRRRPPLALIPLSTDLFVGSQEPYSHYQFERNANGVTGFAVLGPHGPIARNPRN
jgi:hypothetical protein